MQQGANGAAVSPGTQQNGTATDSSGAHTNGNIAAETDGDGAEVNGEESESGTPLPKIMDKTNQDIVRLIGQHLKTVGLEYGFTTLCLGSCDCVCVCRCVVTGLSLQSHCQSVDARVGLSAGSPGCGQVPPARHGWRLDQGRSRPERAQGVLEQ